MELYTLDALFNKDTVVDEYNSLIWTERYSTAGDFNLVLPVTDTRRLQLAEGKCLALADSDEIMQVETQNIEAGLMTVTGNTLEKFFNERWIWRSTDPAVSDWIISGHPGDILATIVNDMLISSTQLSNGALGIGALLNKMQYLVIGAIDGTDPSINVKVPYGPLYDALEPIAVSSKLGMKLYLSRADPFGYEITFTVYKGLDRTSDQLENELVRFSSTQDSMTNVKELHSVSGYKTVVYVFPPDWSSATAPVVQFAPGTDPAATDFERRVMVLRASDITADQVTGGVTLLSLMTKAGVDALANNNFTKVIDGEVVPQNQFKYREHYNLGDIIELEAQAGAIQHAQITEFIRSKDASGERAYPTVSVV